MARKRNDRITESLQTLRALEKKHKGTREGERAALLRILKEDPARTLTDAALQLGRSRPTVQRWWDAYRQQGLDALIHVPRRSGGRPTRLSAEHLDALKQKVHGEGVRDISVLRNWMKKELGVEYSRQGVQYLLKEKVGKDVMMKLSLVQPSANIVRTRSSATAHSDLIPESGKKEDDGVDTVPFSREAVRFLNSLPIMHDVREWIVIFRENLRLLLGDVDRISVAVNVDCDLRDPENFHRKITITQAFEDSKASNTVMVHMEDMSPSMRMSESLKGVDFPFSAYHDPEMFECYLKQSAYVGVVFLWREKDKPAISKRTLEMVVELEPFMVFLLSDIVARHKYSDRTIDGVFNESLAIMGERVELSRREKQVLILQLFGHSYDQISTRLSLSINAIRKYVASIHRKTDTHSFTELFAKYFTPSLGF